MLKFIKHLFLFAMLVVLIAILSLSMHGVPDALTRRIERRLQLPGITVTLAKIKLGMFEGIIATGVCCYRQGDIGAPLLAAERIVLQPRLLHRQPGAFGLRRVTIKNARASLPLDGPADSGQPVILENAQAQIVFDTPRRLRVEEFSGALAGVNVAGRGRITLPERVNVAGRGRITLPERRLESAALPGLNPAFRQGLQYYRRLRFEHPPNLTAEFDLHPGQPASNRVRCRLEVQDAAFEEHRTEGLACDFRLEGSTLTADLQLAQARLWDIPVEQFSAILEINDRELRVRKLEAFAGAGNQRGPVNLQLSYDRRGHVFNGRAQTWCNPGVILPVLNAAGLAQAADTINDFSFSRTPPHINTDFRGSLAHQPRVSLNGIIQANYLVYEGVPVELAQSAFTAEFAADRAELVFSPLAATRREGAMQGRLTLDFDAGLADFDALSSVDPQAAARMIHPVIAEILAPFHFRGPTQTRAAGQIGFTGTDRDAVELIMECQRAGWGFLTPDYCNLSLSVVEDTIEIGEIAGAIFNGKFAGAISFMPGAARDAPFFFEAVLDAADINFNKLMRERLGDGAAPYQGRLSLQLRAAGPVDLQALDQLTGNGRLRIANGRIFQIPLFGGLSELLGKIIPGLNMVMRQTDVRARFSIRRGRIRVEEVLVEGDVFSLRANGDYHFNGRLDFKVQVNLLRQHTLVSALVRLATLPLSKALEFELTGTLDEPRWRLAYIPRDLRSIFGGSKNDKQ